ncbi:MAG: hypothetical protein U1A78_13800 [Polyangia bacterium]
MQVSAWGRGALLGASLVGLVGGGPAGAQPSPGAVTQPAAAAVAPATPLALPGPAAGGAPAAAPPPAAPPAGDEAFDAAVRTPGNERDHQVKRHYMWSNERRHDLFFADLQGLGGGYLGVGADQNYTLAAAAGSQVLWLIDLDGAVVRVHHLYSALVSEAATPEALLALFEKPALPTVKAVLERRAAGEAEALLELYQTYRDDLRDHLQKQRGRPHTWLGDDAKYAAIRGLMQRGRVVARLGDLNGSHTVQQIAQAARAAGVPVRVIYLSNAESWFRYGHSFRHNLTALPLDERGVVLRTVKSEILRYPTGDIWHYSAQRAQDFAAHLRGRGYPSVDTAMLDAVEGSARGSSRIGFDEARALSPGERRREQERREQLLARGLVTRPDGNRESAAELDKDRRQRAARELANR